MRSPRPLEAAFVQELLIRTRPTSVVGLRATLAQRTRYHMKARLYERGILKDRYIPDPAGVGRPIVVFGLAETYAEGSEVARRAWAANRHAIHLWAADGWQMGVFVAGTRREAQALCTSLDPSHALRSEFVLACDSRRATIPVFFDFEGAWARAMGLPGVRGYPRAMPSSTFTERPEPPALTAPDQRAIDALLARPFATSSGAPGRAWWRRPALAPREHRLLADGLVEFRTVLDPVECRRWIRGFYSEMVWVAGRLKEGATAERLFTAVVRAGVLPFFFASDGSSSLLAYLSGRGGAQDLPDTPSGPELLPALRASLEGIVVFRERLDLLRTALDLRFDRLGCAPRSGSASLPTEAEGVPPSASSSDPSSPARSPG